MKTIFVATLIAFTSISTFANNYPGFRQIANSKGTVKLYTRPDLNNKGMSIVISGPAAKVMFNKMSNDLMGTVDASERANGKRLVWKSGKNIYCSTEIDGKDQYECSIQVQDNSQGEVAEPGVG